MVGLNPKQVPDRLRATFGGGKIVPRRLARRVLPPGLHGRPKRGFAVPLRRWFAGPWGTFIEEVLSEAEPALFDRAVIQRMIDEQRRGYHHTDRLFALTMFELWRRRYDPSLPG